MARDLLTIPELLQLIQVIADQEESRYDEIPGWNGEAVEWTGKAVLLRFPKRPPASRDIWLPISQLRKAGDDLSIYASSWILGEKDLQ